MPFPTLSTPLPHNHKQNGNYPRNSCTLYLKTAPPLANSHPEANLHVAPRDQRYVFKSQKARARGPVCSHGRSRSNRSMGLPHSFDSHQRAEPSSLSKCPAKGPQPQLFCQLLLLYSFSPPPPFEMKSGRGRKKMKVLQALLVGVSLCLFIRNPVSFLGPGSLPASSIGLATTPMVSEAQSSSPTALVLS